VTEKEATARIKINKLLETAVWRFFPHGDNPANIRLEPAITIKPADLDAPQKYRTLVPEYVKDYVSLNLFVS